MSSDPRVIPIRAATVRERPVFALIVAILVCGAAFAADLGPDLLAAARKGDSKQLQALLDRGAPVNAADKNGRTALMVAASHGHPEIVRTLLAKGAKPTARDKQGYTALGLAILSTAPEREAVLQAFPPSEPLHLGLDITWGPDNVYSSCSMNPTQLAQHLASLHPDAMTMTALRDFAVTGGRRLVQFNADETGDAVLHLRVRPGVSCTQPSGADNLSLAIDARVTRTSDGMQIFQKTFGGGLKGLHARTVNSPAQYQSILEEWAKSHASEIYWAALEAWLRTP